MPAPSGPDVNRRVIEQNAVKGRTRELPAVPVPMMLADGEPVEGGKLPTVTIAPGVIGHARLGTRRAARAASRCSPDAVYPEQTLGEELIVIVRDGSATIEFDGKTRGADEGSGALPAARRRRDRSRPARTGWKAFEVYSPVRLDHLALAGQNTSGVERRRFADQGVTPSLQPGVVVNLNEIPVDADHRSGTRTKSYRRSTAQSRLIWGTNAQISLVRMDPGSEIPLHIHPEDQLTPHDPGHARPGRDGRHVPRRRATRATSCSCRAAWCTPAQLGEFGADQLDVFWPVRPDYVERAQKQRALYEQVVAPGEKPQKLADGFTFAEGPTWLKGKLYFSDMFFQNPAAGDWTGSPARSRLIVMKPDGKCARARRAACSPTARSPRATATCSSATCSATAWSRWIRRPAAWCGCVLDKVDGKPDRRSERSGDGREGRPLHHRSAVHARSAEEPAGQAGLLRGAGRHGAAW